jgi:hypothetical protein
MPSKRTATLRGNAFQDEIEKFFLKTWPGCAVHNQKPSGKRIFYKDKVTQQMKMGFVSVRNDIFGAFDLIVMPPEGFGIPLYIQATLHTGIGEKKKCVETVPWNPLYCNYEIWQKKPRKGVRILWRTRDGWMDRGTATWEELRDLLSPVDF